MACFALSIVIPALTDARHCGQPSTDRRKFGIGRPGQLDLHAVEIWIIFRLLDNELPDPNTSGTQGPVNTVKRYTAAFNQQMYVALAV
jgi:hypothetical protein